MVRPSAGELFDARSKIHRGADASEIEAVAAADIAVKHGTDMQRQSEAQPVRAGCAVLVIQRGDTRTRCPARLQAHER